MIDAAIESALLPFRLPFMRDAMLMAVLVSVPAALLSCLLVLKGWALMGDAISHAVLPGVVLAYMIGAPLALGAFAAGMGCALAVGWLDANTRVKPDTVMGVVFSGMFGLGIVLYAAVRTDVHLDHILFGDILGVGPADLVETGAIAAVATAALIGLRRSFLLHAFDPAHARAVGLPVRGLHYGLLALVSLTVVAALKAVGIILAIAFLVTPGAVAFLLTRRFGPMLAVSALVASAAALGGVWLSFQIDAAPAPTIVLLLTLAFVGAFLAAGAQARRRSRPAGSGSAATDADPAPFENPSPPMPGR